MMAAAGRLRGEVDLVAVRLPSVAALTAMALLVLGIGTRLRGPRAGLAAGAALLASPLAIHAGRGGARLDTVLAALVLAAIAASVLSRSRPPFAFVAGAFLGLSVLAKGPVGIPFYIAFFLARGRPPLAGVVVGGALVLGTFAWAVPREQLRGLVLQDDLATGASQHLRLAPVHLAWFVGGLGGVAPWFLAALAGAVERARQGGLRAAMRVDPALFATLLALAFLTLVPGKRAHYVVPVYPLAALSIGAVFDRAWTPVEARLVELWSRAVPSLALVLVGVLLTLATLDAALLPWAAACAATTAALRGRGPVNALVLTLALTALGAAAWHERGTRLALPENGAPAIGAAVRRLARETPLALHADPEAVFFAGERPFADVRGEVAPVVSWVLEHPGGAVVIDEASLGKLPGKWTVLARGAVRRREVVLVSPRRPS